MGDIIDTTDTGLGTVFMWHRDRTRTLLSAMVEADLTGHAAPQDPAAGPWDLWWVCYRTQRSATRLGLDPRHAPTVCEACKDRASSCAFPSPPRHPALAGERPCSCSCLTEWALSMRRPGPEITWPTWYLTVGMVKPGADVDAARAALDDTHTLVDCARRSLTAADVRRLYPDAYGAEFVARTEDYLTSGPVTVLVLLRKPTTVGSEKEIKADIRRRLGGGDALRNHLHMPDSPGDAFADLDHLAGPKVFLPLYERYEDDRAAGRLARYRALLALAHPWSGAG